MNRRPLPTGICEAAAASWPLRSGTRGNMLLNVDASRLSRHWAREKDVLTMGPRFYRNGEVCVYIYIIYM